MSDSVHFGSTTTLPTLDETIKPAESSRFYHPELDCLRFFAFFAVFLFHTLPNEAEFYSSRHIPFGVLFSSVARAGSFGVDLFFALSAYLITALLLREKEETGTVHLKAFYVRRILRIWPLYFFAIGIAVLLTKLDPSQHFGWAYVASFLLLCGNWVVSLVAFPGSVMNPLWSVSFEEQFYLLWPTIVKKGKTGSLLSISAGIVGLALVSRLVLMRYGRSGDSAIFTNTLTRLDPLAFGVVVAVLTNGRELALKIPLRFFAVCAGLVLLVISGHFYARTIQFMLLGYPGVALGAALILIGVLGSGFGPKWLIYLGKISYGLYVFHLLGVYLALKIVGGYNTVPKYFAYWSLALLLTISMAAASYQFLEKYFLLKKEKFAFVKSRPA